MLSGQSEKIWHMHSEEEVIGTSEGDYIVAPVFS